MKTIMLKPDIKLVHDYVTTLHRVVKRNKGLSYLNAETLNKKVTNILFKHPINKDDNFDIVTYNQQSNTYLTQRFFDIFEEYIRMNIYELTGITYSEYKNMPIVEKSILLKYISFKLDSLDINIESLTPKANTNNDAIFK